MSHGVPLGLKAARMIGAERQSLKAAIAAFRSQETLYSKSCKRLLSSYQILKVRHDMCAPMSDVAQRAAV